MVGTVTVGNGPAGVAITPNGAFAYVSNSVDNSVSVIATATNMAVGEIQALIDAGTLTQNQGDVLLNKIAHAIGSLNNGQTSASCGQLGSFFNQINAFINDGSLTQAQGQALIDAANTIRASNGC